MKNLPDYSSRFRILKGGKISLVVSALLVGSSVVGTGLYAQDVITAAQTTTQQYDYSAAGDTDVDLNVTTGSIAVTGAGAQTAVDIIRPSASPYNTTITNEGTVSAYSTDSSTSMAISIMGYSAGYTTGSVSITNSGTISATTAGDSKGIYIADHDALMNIRNDTTGVISAQADNGTAKGIDVYTSNIDGLQLTNSGTISATAGSGGNEAYGVQFRSNNDLNVNNTTIKNQSGADISATSVNSYAVGMDFYSGNYLVLDTTSITNAGTISAISTNYNAYGIRLKGNSGTKLYDTSIMNSGTITATAGNNSKAYGIYAGNLYFNSTKSFIKNTGTISAIAGYQGSATAIYSGSMRGPSYISNAANQTISALAGNGDGYTQAQAQAIQIGNMNDSSHITNAGTISAEAGYQGTAYALKIGNMGDSSNITNESGGEISATVGYNSTAKGIYVSNLATTITNNGTISALADHDANAYGLYIGSMIDSSRIINSGTISATADYNSNANGIRAGNLSTDSVISNTNGHIISVEAGNNSDATGINTGNLYGTSHITNSGTISVTTGSNGTARGIDSGYLRDTAYIKNSSTGTLDVSGTNAYGIMASMDTTSTITNQGTISADGTNSAYGMMINNSVSGAAITNSGTITATIGNQADAAAYSLVTQGTASVHNTSIGNLNGNLNIAGTLTNDGMIRLPYNATSATVSNFINNGTLQIGMLTDGTLGGTTHSTLNTDDAVFNSGSKIDVNVLAASTHADLLVNQTIQDVVTANNSLTINGTLTVTDNSALLNFEYVQDGNTIDLNVVQGTTLIDSAAAGGGSSNTQAAASALQTIQDAGSYPEMDDFFTALNTLGSDAEVSHAIESTTPVAANASSSATTQIMNGVQGMVGMRQSNTMGAGGMNSGDINLVDKNLWVKLFGSRGSQDKKDGINGFDVKAHGLGIGADAEVSPRQRVGAAFFYTDASVDVNDMPQTSDLKVYTAIVYGNVPLNVNTDFLYQAGYSWQKTESERVILPTYDHAKADYTSKTASLNLEVMQSYNLRNDLTVHPLVETTYRHNTNPSYSESGAGALNLQVDSFTSSQFITGGGVILDYKLDKDSKLTTDLRAGYDWHHNAQTVTASYQGAAGVDFTTSGIDNGGWQYDIGLGYETTKVLGGGLEFMYNHQVQGGFRNDALSAKYTYKF